MKKYLILILFTSFIYNSSNAQVKVGLLGGMNISDAKQDQFFFTYSKIKTKLMFGAVADIPVANNFSIRLEPLYIEKGTESGQIKIEGFSAKASFELSYFEVPILLTFTTGNTLKPFVFVGPTIGFNTASDVSLDAGIFELAVDAENISEEIEYSINIGGGINFQVDDFISIFLETRYVFGLNDVIKKGEFELSLGNLSGTGKIPPTTKYMNKGLQFMAGFSFPITID